MKLAIVMLNSILGIFCMLILVGLHRFICLATVVSRSCAMSLKWPWNRVNKRFLV